MDFLFFAFGGVLLLTVAILFASNRLDDILVRLSSRLSSELLVEKGINRKWQAAAEYILSQEGDDLCWRDFYVELGNCLPDGHALKDLAKLKSFPPAPIMERNCRRFGLALRAGEPYEPFNREPLTAATALVPPIVSAEVTLAVHRRNSLPILRWHSASVSFSPAEYASSERFQLLVGEQMNRLIEAIDKEERAGG